MGRQVPPQDPKGPIKSPHPLDIQRQIVLDLEAERALVEANRKLIEVFEKKIQSKLAGIWGEV